MPLFREFEKNDKDQGEDRGANNEGSISYENRCKQFVYLHDGGGEYSIKNAFIDKSLCLYAVSGISRAVVMLSITYDPVKTSVLRCT